MGREVRGTFVRAAAELFPNNAMAGSGFEWVYEDNCNARLMPALSKQSDSTIEAQRDVRIIRPEHDTDATVSVRGLRSAFLRVCFCYGREST